MADLYEADRALARRVLRGDEAAFDEFFDAYSSRLYRFAAARTGRGGDAAEEIVQLTLTKVLRKLSTYRGEAALFTWLCTFCRHEISAHHVRRERVADRKSTRLNSSHRP